MSLIVVKFGGTSVATAERIQVVADIVVKCRGEGHEVVVVASAMGNETNRLDALAHSLSASPSPREKDVLLAAGEQVCIALLAIALHDRGYSAKSYLGDQIRVLTDQHHTRAEIEHIETDKLMQSLANDEIPVIAGFQGRTTEGEITTIGRGGSDTTAVAVAAALNAVECRIYTDVDGVYTADPRIVEPATQMGQVSFEEMLEMASLGAKVLHLKSVEYARLHGIQLRVLSSFRDVPGTLITEEEEQPMDRTPVSAVTYDNYEAKVTVTQVPDVPGVAYRLLGPIADAGICVDMIVQNVSVEGFTNLTFTVPRVDFEQTLVILRQIVKEFPARDETEELGDMEVLGDDSIAKVTVVGLGMRSNVGVASKMFETLAQYGINIQMISTSEIKISVVIHEDFCEAAVRVLHSAFELDNPRGQG